MRWVAADQLHLTLVFLGEVDASRAESARELFALPVEQPIFDLVFGGVGAFPPRGAPRALWIGIRGGTAALGSLQAEMAGRASRLGIELERRGFSPHLTIA